VFLNLAAQFVRFSEENKCVMCKTCDFSGATAVGNLLSVEWTDRTESETISKNFLLSHSTTQLEGKYFIGSCVLPVNHGFKGCSVCFIRLWKCLFSFHRIKVAMLHCFPHCLDCIDLGR
jgi:hypothetical protein